MRSRNKESRTAPAGLKLSKEVARESIHLAGNSFRSPKSIMIGLPLTHEPARRSEVCNKTLALEKVPTSGKGTLQEVLLLALFIH